MWSDQFANLIINTFDIMGPASQGAVVMVSLGIYAAVIIAVVGGVVFILENLNE